MTAEHPSKATTCEKKQSNGDWEKVNDYPIAGEKATVDDLIEGNWQDYNHFILKYSAYNIDGYIHSI